MAFHTPPQDNSAFWYFSTKHMLCVLKCTYTLKLIDKVKSQFLLYELDLCDIQNAFFHEMQIWLHYYTVVSYQTLFNHQFTKIQPYTSWMQQKNVLCMVHDLGSLTIKLLLPI